MNQLRFKTRFFNINSTLTLLTFLKIGNLIEVKDLRSIRFQNDY